MALAIKKYFSRQNIAAQKFSASEELAEQAVFCLELVSQLTDAGLDFQFKGGNSLLLILEKPQRFSIDVDIATDETREDIEACLDRIINDYNVFDSWEKRAHKTKPWLPISSYYLFFQSAVSLEKTSIMLDVQLRKSPYATHKRRVSCGKLYQSEIEAVIPYPASIIGDKLLTMGPQTLGIPLGKGKQAQRLKHVFDIAVLSEMIPSLSLVRESLYGCLKQENTLQEKSITAKQVMDDTLAFCGSVLYHKMIPEKESVSDPILKENITGLPDFAAHLFTDQYRWEHLQRDMSKAAVCICAACVESVSQNRFEDALRGNEISSDETIGIVVDSSYIQNAWKHITHWLGYNPIGMGK